MDSISKLDSTTKVVTRSMHESIYPSIDVLNQNGYPNWNAGLTSIFNTAKQIDALYQEVDPKLSLYVPLPKQNIIYGESTIPQLLSTALAPEEVSCIETYGNELNVPSDWENINNHNDNIEDIIENFSNAIDTWRDEIKQKSKTRKRDR